MREWFITILAGLALGGVPALVGGVSQPSGPADSLYVLRRWSAEDGLPAGGVSEIVQTRDGYLWMGTRFGLVRFDGVRFRVFDKYNTPGLEDDAITGLASSVDGALWVGGAHGLIEWRDERVAARYGRQSGLPSDHIWQLAPRSGGGVWWRAGQRVGFVAEGRCVSMPAVEEGREREVLRIRPGRDGGLLALTISGLHRADPGGRRLEWVMPLVSPGSSVVYDVSVAGDGTYWRGGHEGVERHDGGRWQRVGTWPEDPHEFIDWVRQGTDGTWWAATRRGELRVLQDGEWVSPAGGGEVGRGSVSCLFEDRERSLWVGTERQGIARLGRRRVRVFSVEQGLPHVEAWSVSPARGGGVWVGTGAGLARIRGHGVTPIRGAGAPHTLYRLVLQDHRGTVWIAQAGSVWLYHGEDGLPEGWTPLTDPLLRGGATGLLFEDREGCVWLDADRRMVCFVDGALRPAPVPQFPKQVRAMHQSRDGSLWFGTYGAGAWRRTPSGLAQVTNGLPATERVWSFHEDASGTLWIGTEHGLKRWRDNECRSFGTREGLAEELVNHVVGDEHGQLWLSGLRGIYRVSLADLEAQVAGGGGTVRCAAYGPAEGLPNPETNGEMQPAGCRTDDGCLWFPTMDGVAMIDPGAVDEESSVPEARIEELAAGGVVPARDAGEPGTVRVLPAGSGHALRVRYTACVFSSPSRVRFRHRLLPQHPEWVEGDRERVAYYTNLRPGDYRFEVLAASPLGVWSDRPAVLSLRIEPFLWQTRAFGGLCALAGLAVLAGMHAYHSRWQRRVFRLEQGRALERERARIADDLHDELGANLTGLALKAELARGRAGDSGLQDDLASMASTARTLTDATREIIWLASPRHDSLDSLAGHLAGLVERLAATGGVRCRLDVPPRLPALEVSSAVRHQICLAVKEAGHNALKHAGATAIHFCCRLGEGEVLFQVSDDGRGFAPDGVAGQGNGLCSMRERVEGILGGSLRIRSNAGEGTSVEIQVPRAHLTRRHQE